MNNEKNIQEAYQMALFTENREERILMSVRLEAESALGAWYELALVVTKIGYLIEKHSGAQGRGHQVETWFRRDFAEAEKKYSNILAAKTNPKRRSPRKYRIVKELASAHF